MYDRDKKPLGVVAESAYEVLVETVDPENGIQRSGAHERLVEVYHAESDSEYAIDRLLSRRYLYDVDGRLFVTEKMKTLRKSSRLRLQDTVAILWAGELIGDGDPRFGHSRQLRKAI